MIDAPVSFPGYCVRINDVSGASYGDRISMLTAVEDYSRIHGLHHNGDRMENPHFHLVITTTVKEKAFRARMVKVFNAGKGNGHMSIKLWNGDEKALSYLYHEEGSNPSSFLVNKGYDVDDIHRFKEQHAQIAKEVKKNNNKASWKLIDEAFKEFDGEYIPTEYEVFTWLIKECLKRDKYIPTDFQAKSYVKTIRMRKSLHMGQVSHFIDEEYARIFRAFQ